LALALLASSFILAVNSALITVNWQRASFYPMGIAANVGDTVRFHPETSPAVNHSLTTFNSDYSGPDFDATDDTPVVLRTFFTTNYDLVITEELRGKLFFAICEIHNWMSISISVLGDTDTIVPVTLFPAPPEPREDIVTYIDVGERIILEVPANGTEYPFERKILHPIVLATEDWLAIPGSISPDAVFYGDSSYAYSHRFTEVGVYRWICALHEWMRGTVVVCDDGHCPLLPGQQPSHPSHDGPGHHSHHSKGKGKGKHVHQKPAALPQLGQKINYNHMMANMAVNAADYLVELDNKQQ